MIICSCNVLSDQQVRTAVSAADTRPRSISQVYYCLGCSARCGRCTRAIKRIMDEALGAYPRGCGSSCIHGANCRS